MRPIAGNGENVTATNLSIEWKALPPQDDVVEFYGVKQGVYKCFSNFYEELDMSFDFKVPEEVIAPGLGPVQRTVKCNFPKIDENNDSIFTLSQHRENGALV